MKKTIMEDEEGGETNPFFSKIKKSESFQKLKECLSAISFELRVKKERKEQLLKPSSYPQVIQDLPFLNERRNQIKQMQNEMFEHEKEKKRIQEEEKKNSQRNI